MKDDRLQLRIAPELKEEAQRIAKAQGTTLSALVTQYLLRVIEIERSKHLAGDDGVEQA